jgi:hypothetical protein
MNAIREIARFIFVFAALVCFWGCEGGPGVDLPAAADTNTYAPNGPMDASLGAGGGSATIGTSTPAQGVGGATQGAAGKGEATGGAESLDAGSRSCSPDAGTNCRCALSGRDGGCYADGGCDCFACADSGDDCGVVTFSQTQR